MVKKEDSQFGTKSEGSTATIFTIVSVQAAIEVSIITHYKLKSYYAYRGTETLLT